jgi:hypothetical protein
MRNWMTPWRYTLLTLRLDLLWLPGGLWILFALVTMFKHANGQVFEEAAGFFGFALPLIAGILASSAVLDNPALELHFAAPRPAWRVLLERQGLLMTLIAVAALTFQIYLLALNVDMSRLGLPINRQLAWLLPTLALMELGCVGAFILKQSMGGAMLVGVVWILQLIGHEWFMRYDMTRRLFIFLNAYAPEHPDLFANQIVVLIFSVILFVLAWALLKQQERYL